MNQTSIAAGISVLSSVLLAAACADVVSPDLLIEPIQIESVEVSVLESFPPRAVAHVKGVLGDGCAELHSVQQERTGSTVTLTILRERPRDAVCTMIAKLDDQNIPLTGDYPPGSYLLLVNGFEKRFVTQ